MSQTIDSFRRILWTFQLDEHPRQLQLGKRFTSQSFEVPLAGRLLKFSLRFLPHENKVCKAFVALFVKLISVEPAPFKFEAFCKLGLLGKTKEESDMSKSFSTDNEQLKKGVGFSGFLSHEDFDAERFLVNGSLTVVCELNLTTSIISEPPPEPIKFDTNFLKMLDEELFTDFELKTRDGKVLKTHKCVLASRSPVFKAMFTSDMIEANGGFVDIQDIDSRTMKEALRFIYGGEVTELDEMAQDLVYVAEKYQLEELKEICLNKIIENLSVKNLTEALVIAVRVSNAEKLFEKCFKMIEECYHLVIKESGWKLIPADVLARIYHEKVCQQQQTIYV